MSVAAFEKVKAFVSMKMLEKVAEAATDSDEGKLADFFELLSRLSPVKYYREGFLELAGQVRRGTPFALLVRRLLTDLGDNSRKKAITNFFVNFLVLGRGIRDRKEAELGIHIPNFLVISPTMRCNLKCRGCYAGDYDREEELTFGELDRLIYEAKDLGMYFFTFSGGECFTRPDLLDLWERHDDCFFHVYTNGTLLDDEMTSKLADLGNVAPMVSVEGSREETDHRRGAGVYDRVMEAFSRLRSKGILYGFSATFTRSSARYLLSDEFIERMLDLGCKVGWFFQYIPAGASPDLKYMATPDQRRDLHIRVMEWRKKYPLFLGDFWNDGSHVDGCMAAGERFMHIISNGDVEPCVFAHFAVDNIREKSLVDIIGSPFFKYIREQQPYDDDNLLRPCMIIDHPHILREAVELFGARPSHSGSESILGELADGLDKYASGVKAEMDPLWNGGERDRYLASLEKEDKPRSREKINKRLPRGQRTG
ncbi:MAG TPA: radical SAM protein [Synergistetes bacterium]|nr:radical SAM protein [Synergistota bacterium]